MYSVIHKDCREIFAMCLDMTAVSLRLPKSIAAWLASTAHLTSAPYKKTINDYYEQPEQNRKKPYYSGLSSRYKSTNSMRYYGYKQMEMLTKIR